MTVRVIHASGLGDHPYGAVIEMDDRRARRLILIGYLAEVKPPKRKEKD